MTHGRSDASVMPTSVPARVRDAARWRLDAIGGRMRRLRTAGLADHIRCRLELGFALPDLETMQNYARMKFLHDCIVRFAPSGGVALEIGCYKCSSTVFIAKACARTPVRHTCAMDLFTGTPSWKTSVDYLDAARRTIAAYRLGDQVTLIRADAAGWKDAIAVLHIDADHAYEAVWQDIRKYTPFLAKDGIVVFDDYDVSHPGVTKAVHRLLSEDPHYQVVAANYQGLEFGSVCLRRTAS